MRFLYTFIAVHFIFADTYNKSFRIPKAEGFSQHASKMFFSFRETVGYSFTLLSIYFSLFLVYSKLFPLVIMSIHERFSI